jgi:hypothetical protein
MIKSSIAAADRLKQKETTHYLMNEELAINGL